MPVFIDLNVGMDRTGVAPELALPLCRAVATLPHVVVKGLHAYDGHVRDADYGVPFHVCPTIALHDQATVVSDGRVVEHWHTTRHRSIEHQ